MVDIDIEEYYAELMQDVYRSSGSESSYLEDEFFQKARQK